MLTEKRIKSAVPPEGKSEINLRDEEGLVLRVRRNADGSITRTWAFWREREGKRQRAALGAWPDVSLVEARRRAEHHRRLADAGVRVTTALVPAALSAHPQTFGELANTWLQLYAVPRHKDKGARTRWLLNKHAAMIADVPLANLTKQHVTLTVLPLVNARHHKTAGDLFALLKQVCAFGVRHDFIAADPVGALRRADVVPRRNRPRERALAPAELQRLAVACVAERTVGPAGRTFVVPVVPPVAALAVFAILATACRPGELALATWPSVDLRQRIWKIPAADSKIGIERRVPLSPFAAALFEVLKEIAAGEPRVLPMGRAALSRLVKDRQRAETRRSGKRAHNDGLLLDAPWTLHDLRRTSATLLGEAGVAPSTIELTLGHLPSRLVQTYQRADRTDEQRAAFELLGTRLAALAPELLTTLRARLALA